MIYEYGDKVLAILKQAEEVNKNNIDILAKKFAENIEADKLIHCFGSGHSHMVGIEMFGRAGGLGNVDAMLDPDVLTSFGAVRSSKIEQTCGLAEIIYNNYEIEQGDIMIITSNSGRNALPIEMAMKAKKEGIYTVAITNLKQSSSQTSRHPSGKRLFELADLVIDSCVPEADASLDLDGIKTGPISSIVTMFLVNTVISEAIKLVLKDGKRPYVLQSQNMDGFSNDDIYAHFAGRIKHY